jgi:hypothetical protein
MRQPLSIPRLLFGVILSTAVSLAAVESTLALVGSNNESRTVIALRVGQAGLQSWVPAPG